MLLKVMIFFADSCQFPFKTFWSRFLVLKVSIDESTIFSTGQDQNPRHSFFLDLPKYRHFPVNSLSTVKPWPWFRIDLDLKVYRLSRPPCLIYFWWKWSKNKLFVRVMWSDKKKIFCDSVIDEINLSSGDQQSTNWKDNWSFEFL